MNANAYKLLRNLMDDLCRTYACDGYTLSLIRAGEVLWESNIRETDTLPTSMDTNDHKLLRKLLDDLGREHEYDNGHYWALQLDSGMVAEVSFLGPATLPTNMDEPCCERCARKINNDDRLKFDIPRGMTHAAGCAGAECIENGYKCYVPREGVEQSTLPELVNASPDVACCAHEIGDVVCASACGGSTPCRHGDGRCCEVCAHYSGGKLTETCYSCSMLSQWQESELTDAEIEALTDDDIMPDYCLSCKHSTCDVYDEPCNECTDEKYSVYINWEPRD